MSRTTDLGKERKKAALRKAVKRLILVLFAAAIVFAVYQMRFEIANEGPSVWVADAVDQLTYSGGYPVAIDRSSQRQLASIGSRIAVVSEGDLSIYNSAGREVLSSRLNYQNPIAVSAGKWLMLFDRGGTALSIRMGSRTLIEQNFDLKLYTAALAADGGYAVVTGSNGYLAQMMVYDSNFNERFTWYSSENMLYLLSFDPHAQMIAAAGVSTSGGMLRSTIVLFSVSNGTELYKTTIDNELILGLHISVDGEATVVTDRSLARLSKTGEVTGRASFNGEKVGAFAIDSGGRVAAALGDYEKRHHMELMLFDKSAKPIARAEVEHNITSMSFGKRIVAFAGDRTLLYDENLSLQKNLETADAVTRLVVGDTLYYTTLRELRRVSLSQ